LARASPHAASVLLKRFSDEQRESPIDGYGRPVLARFAGMSDVDAIRRICTEGHRTTYADLLDRNEIERIIDEYYRPERIRSELAVALPHWGGWVVADDGGGAIVAAGGGGLTAETVGELFVLYADPQRRRQGAGTAVLELISDQQRQAGASTQEVAVLDTNEIGLAFYATHGFEAVGRRRYHEAGQGERQLVLRRAL
jgi:GNAT superfamily N-acetyltransferase